MRKRSVFKLFCFILYALLVVLFFAYLKKENGITDEETCDASHSCRRLCHSDENLKFLNESLDFEPTNDPLTYKVLNGSLCENMKTLNENQWNFSSSGSISVNETSIPENKYCLQLKDAEATDTESQWSLMVCDGDQKFYETAHVVLSITAIVILSLVLLLYISVNELKSLRGKCVIGFLVALILACIYSRVLFIDSNIKDILINFSLIFAILWINVLIFDVWWTLSFFDSSSGGKFKFYLYYVLGCATAAFICSLISIKIFLAMMYGFLLLFMLTTSACFVFAAMKIYEMTGTDRDFGSKRFHHEEARFLLYLQMFTLTLITWTIELCAREFAESRESLIIADILLCVESIVLFVILVLKRNVREVIIRNVCCC